MMYFTSPKFKGRTIKKMIEMVDKVKEWGFNAICMGIPYHGGIQYSGLDVLDYYAVDPALGTMDDFDELVSVCHDRDIAFTAFLNLGYAAMEFPPFIQACDDVKAGVESPESRWFVWSDTKSAELDRSQLPFFLNDVEGSWQFSERAGKYFGSDGSASPAMRICLSSIMERNRGRRNAGRLFAFGWREG